jgi:hypothetical protein
MGFAVSKLYIQEYFDKNARNQVLYWMLNKRIAIWLVTK